MSDLTHRFRFHPARTVERQLEHETVRDLLGRTAETLDAHLPAGREKSLVLTKLEEAMFWANAAIARQPQDDDDPPAPVLALVA